MTYTNITSAIFGWETRFICQIPRFQSPYNVHEYRHRLKSWGTRFFFSSRSRVEPYALALLRTVFGFASAKKAPAPTYAILYVHF
jgi:hypothetical protein